MKVSELWLREWVNPELSREQLCAQLTLAGLEVEEIAPVVEQFTGVVIGKILQIDKHPEADRLTICLVDIGQGDPISIVCGAKNVRVGMRVPTALVGAMLPNKKEIIQSDLRGVTSYGMLCSAVEIGLAEQSEGLMQLPDDAPIGKKVWDYFHLSDYVIDVSITPNRGDCLSVLGLAKEITAVTQCTIKSPTFNDVPPQIKDTLKVKLNVPEGCSRYVGRVIRGVKADSTTPIWMQERLRRAGVRSINPIVDVMNYVMLEVGQPMHAFDLERITGEIVVRQAAPSESLALLDGQDIQLTSETLIIADEKHPLAIAGVMGGLNSAVTLLTHDIFLESAYFNPISIAQTVRHFGLNSESSYRFERGMDPTMQRIAIERATELLLEIVGGEAGPVIDVMDPAHLPKAINISLRKTRLERVLGFNIPEQTIEETLTHLGLTLEKNSDGWLVTIPPRRSDITLEIDLIEEIIRLHGFDKLPIQDTLSTPKLYPRSETKVYLPTFRTVLRDQGFNEVITYSFIDKKLQKLFDPNTSPKELLNPMTAEMAVMRTTLWPGLVNTLLYNLNRQQHRVRLFETGLRFIQKDGQLLQQRVMSGLINGLAYPEQWGMQNREVDFFDLKGHLENIFNCTFAQEEFNFTPSHHPALHPGQTAEITRNGKCVGLIGSLHPSLMQILDISSRVFLFELALDDLENASLPQLHEISKFPEIRRDIAILVEATVPARLIQDTIKEVVGDLLQAVSVFDVYQGKGILPTQKSVALALTLQHTTRTLRDEEVANLMERVIVALKDQFAAVLRS